MVGTNTRRVIALRCSSLGYARVSPPSFTVADSNLGASDAHKNLVDVVSLSALRIHTTSTWRQPPRVPTQPRPSRPSSPSLPCHQKFASRSIAAWYLHVSYLTLDKRRAHGFTAADISMPAACSTSGLCERIPSANKRLRPCSTRPTRSCSTAHK